MKDRWLIWPYICLATLPIVFIAIYAYNLDMGLIFLLPVCGLLLVGFFVVMPFVAVGAYRTGRMHRALSAICIPAYVVLIALSCAFLANIGNTLFFYRIHSSLQQEVERTPGPDRDKLLIWLEGGFLSAGYGFVYDGSDELMRPAGSQSPGWKQRAKQTDLGDSCFEADHITGHYYSFSTTHGC